MNLTEKELILLVFIMQSMNFCFWKKIYIEKTFKNISYKRATLLVEDLFQISQTIKNNIKTNDNFLGCADYVIPKTLRHYGILEYNEELSKLVDNQSIIEHDSNFEIEIRSNMLYALELIKEKINSIKLDNLIWVTERNINALHHLTETIYY